MELTKEVVELATATRVRHGLRTPDALPAASGLQLGADHVFLTGDAAPNRVAGLKVKLLLIAVHEPLQRFPQPSLESAYDLVIFEIEKGSIVSSSP